MRQARGSAHCQVSSNRCSSSCCLEPLCWIQADIQRTVLLKQSQAPPTFCVNRVRLRPLCADGVYLPSGGRVNTETSSLLRRRRSVTHLRNKNTETLRVSQPARFSPCTCPRCVWCRWGGGSVRVQRRLTVRSSARIPGSFGPEPLAFFS